MVSQEFSGAQIVQATSWAREVSLVLLPLCKKATQAALYDCAIKQPNNLYLSPGDVLDRISANARQLGVSEEIFITAAVKQPSLFYQKPETAASKKPYIMALADALGYAGNDGFVEVLQKVPAGFACAHNHLHARYVLARLGLKKGKISSLVVISAAKAEKLIIDHFMAKIEATGKGARALQVMRAQGIIKTLPQSIRPIERPARRADRVSVPA